jgi:hypothetical protein
VSEDLFIADIIAQAREGGGVIEGQGPQAPILSVIDCHMTGNAGTSTITDKHQFAALGMGAPRRHYEPFQRLIGRQESSCPILCLDRADQTVKRREILVEPPIGIHNHASITASPG